ncbi:hypothetical protein [Amycolatopsis sp. cmx-11-12]|uniref:hypothetical protein n=1 Tax=Amycolatopsis sp. cmx-11-12 TaxID=2785795 RepID=UPI003916D10F
MRPEPSRLDHVFLARISDIKPTAALTPTANERASVLERRWWTVADLKASADMLLPAGPIQVTDRRPYWSCCGRV